MGSLVNGRLMDILDKNPSGGCRTNGRDSDGVMVSSVPGGRANRPSVVIHNSRFCRELASSVAPSVPLCRAIHVPSNSSATIHTHRRPPTAGRFIPDFQLHLQQIVYNTLMRVRYNRNWSVRVWRPRVYRYGFVGQALDSNYAT